MLPALYYNGNRDLLTEVAPESYANALLEKSGVLWDDFGGEDPGPSEDILLNTFQFHPEAEIIRVELDNLDPPKPATSYETFPPAEAPSILKKLEFHYTLKHGNWLNMPKSN